MGLDIYAGTLSRYYTGNWKTAAQQFAEEQGFSYQMIRAEGSEKINENEVYEAVCNWRDGIVRDLSGIMKMQLNTWEENGQKDYYTEKPDWDAFGALLLLASCLELKRDFPQTVQKGWKWSEHPLIAEASRQASGTLLKNTDIWIPINVSIGFNFKDIYGNAQYIGTVKALETELSSINNYYWKAANEEISSWKRTEGYEADYKVSDSRLTPIENKQECDVYQTESLAKYAFSLFWDAANYAAENNVAVKLDY